MLNINSSTLWASFIQNKNILAICNLCMNYWSNNVELQRKTYLVHKVITASIDFNHWVTGHEQQKGLVYLLQKKWMLIQKTSWNWLFFWLTDEINFTELLCTATAGKFLISWSANVTFILIHCPVCKLKYLITKTRVATSQHKKKYC